MNANLDSDMNIRIMMINPTDWLPAIKSLKSWQISYFLDFLDFSNLVTDTVGHDSLLALSIYNYNNRKPPALQRWKKVPLF